MAAVALFRSWPLVMERLNERKRDSANEKADDWVRLREERDHALERVHTLEAKVYDLQQENFELRSRALTAEAQILGIGMGRQSVAEVEAAKRLAQDKKPEGK